MHQLVHEDTERERDSQLLLSRASFGGTRRGH
jgi:hypothetical protein